MAGLRIGITIPSGIGDPLAALWQSGVHQNAVFLCQLMRHVPGVAFAELTFWPDDGRTASTLAGSFNLPSRPLSRALGDLNVLIELGMRADAGAMRAFRARGGKLVSYMAGNAMVMNFEAVANKTPYGEILNHAGYDAVWITPQHWHTNQAYARLTRSDSVQLAPHIWHPAIFERLAAQFGGLVSPRRQPPFRVGIFDPSVNVVKTFHLPVLVCEGAYRLRPDLIDRVLMFGASGFKGNPHFEEFCGALDLLRAGRLFAEDRHPAASVFGRHIDAVVTHHWENGLNYLYWDTLHAGLPLVHNSLDIADAGFSFSAFDPQSGAQALIQALTSLSAPNVQNAAALWRFNLENPAVQAQYGSLLELLTAPDRRAGA